MDESDGSGIVVGRPAAQAQQRLRQQGLVVQYREYGAQSGQRHHRAGLLLDNRFDQTDFSTPTERDADALPRLD